MTTNPKFHMRHSRYYIQARHFSERRRLASFILKLITLNATKLTVPIIQTVMYLRYQERVEEGGEVQRDADMTLLNTERKFHAGISCTHK